MPQGATHLERLVERVYGLHEWSGAVLEVVGALKVEERDEEPHASALLAENHLALNLVGCSIWHTAHARAHDTTVSQHDRLESVGGSTFRGGAEIVFDEGRQEQGELAHGRVEDRHSLEQLYSHRFLLLVARHARTPHAHAHATPHTTQREA